MKGVGLFVVIAFVLLTLAIFARSCNKEGFLDVKIAPTLKPGLTSVATLPSAPVNNLAQTNSLPYQDPVLEKTNAYSLKQLKVDMDGFAAFELPNLKEYGDPAVSMPLTRFKGDYQRVKDEMNVVDSNPGIEPQLTIQDIDSIGANLRFLQRTYRLYANNQMVPASKTEITKVGEGFENQDPPITPEQLKSLSLKLTIEIARLQASGTNDPVLASRVAIFTKIRQSIDDLNTSLKNGTLSPTAIPIKTSDYTNFLPALGDSSAGISGLLSANGYSSFSSLFNAYDAGDASGADIAAALVDKYAQAIFKGLSFNVGMTYRGKDSIEGFADSSGNKEPGVFANFFSFIDTHADKLINGANIHFGVGYTSENDAAAAAAASKGKGKANDYSESCLHPGKLGARGEFDKAIRQLDLGYGPSKDSYVNAEPSSKGPGKFDWKTRANTICNNISKMGLNPADYGCLHETTQVSSDYSWRGNTKMVCSRLATQSDPAIPEQLGCPPVSWKGWRL